MQWHKGSIEKLGMQDGIRVCNNTIYMYTYSLITVIMATEVSLSPTSVVMDDGDCSEMIPNGLSLPTMVTVACVYSRSAAPPVALVSCTTKLCTQKKTINFCGLRIVTFLLANILILK